MILNWHSIDFTPFSSHNRQAFNGLALVIVKAKKGETGPIVVKAESAGLRSAKVTIETKSYQSLIGIFERLCYYIR